MNMSRGVLLPCAINKPPRNQRRDKGKKNIIPLVSLATPMYSRGHPVVAEI